MRTKLVGTAGMLLCLVGAFALMRGGPQLPETRAELAAGISFSVNPYFLAVSVVCFAVGLTLVSAASYWDVSTVEKQRWGFISWLIAPLGITAMILCIMLKALGISASFPLLWVGVLLTGAGLGVVLPPCFRVCRTRIRAIAHKDGAIP